MNHWWRRNREAKKRKQDLAKWNEFASGVIRVTGTDHGMFKIVSAKDNE